MGHHLVAMENSLFVDDLPIYCQMYIMLDGWFPMFCLAMLGTVRLPNGLLQFIAQKCSKWSLNHQGEVECKDHPDHIVLRYEINWDHTYVHSGKKTDQHILSKTTLITLFISATSTTLKGIEYPTANNKPWIHHKM